MNEENSLPTAVKRQSMVRWIVVGCLLTTVVNVLVRTKSDVSVAVATDHAGTSEREEIAARLASVEPTSLSHAFRTAARRVLPAIVEIKEGGRPPSYSMPESPRIFDDWQSGWAPFDARMRPRSEPSESALGSGIVIDSSGIVLTNSHVVRETRRPIVQLADGRRFEAKHIQADPESDLAILQIDAPTPLPVARLGDSDRLQIGDWVLTLGSPLDLRQTVSAGIISATGRKLETAGDVRLLQTDAAINPGSSGGALVDLRGEVVGVTTAIASHDGGYQGIGLVIPSNLAIWVVNQLRQHGEVRRSTIGIDAATDLSPLGSVGTTKRSTTKVKHVREGSPAETAGVRPGDTIIAFDGISIYEADVFLEMIQQQTVGSEHQLRIERDGSLQTVDVVTERAIRSSPSSREPAWGDSQPTEIAYSRELQLEVSTHQPSRNSRVNEAIGKGVLVLGVNRTGPAFQAGVREGMRIRAVNGQNVHDLDSFVDVMEQASLAQGIELALHTRRGPSTLLINGP